MRGYPLFSFWISITPVKIYISCIVINRGKNIFELVGTVLKTSELVFKLIKLLTFHLLSQALLLKPSYLVSKKKECKLQTMTMYMF